MSEEAWAEARAAEMQADASLWQEEPAARQQPTWAEVLGAQKIIGEQIKITFFGVSDRDGWLNGLKVGRRPLLSADYLCADYFSLKLINGSDGLNLKNFVNQALRGRLGLSTADLLGTEAKIAKLQPGMLGFAAPTEMMALETPLAILYQPGKPADMEITVYLRAAVLRAARTSRAREQWPLFLEEASATLGYKLSETNAASLVGHNLTTIKGAMGMVAGAGATKDGKALADVEKTFKKYAKEGYESMQVDLAVLAMKKGKRPVGAVLAGASAGAAAAQQPVRARRSISHTGKAYIDGHLPAYRLMAGKQRERLIEQILSSAKALADDMGQAAWDASLVGGRLANQFKAQNKAAKPQDGPAQEQEEAAQEAAQEA